MPSTDTNTFHSYLAGFGLIRDELSLDAENVLYRMFENNWAAELDTYRGLDGLLYIRFDR